MPENDLKIAGAVLGTAASIFGVIWLMISAVDDRVTRNTERIEAIGGETYGLAQRVANTEARLLERERALGIGLGEITQLKTDVAEIGARQAKFTQDWVRLNDFLVDKLPVTIGPTPNPHTR